MPPQNFASYRQAELDNQRIGSFAQVQAIPFISNRFALKRFLGLSEEDLAENERLWREENDETLQPPTGDAAGEMRSVGISGAGISADISGAEDQVSIEGGEDGGEGGHQIQLQEMREEPHLHQQVMNRRRQHKYKHDTERNFYTIKNNATYRRR